MLTSPSRRRACLVLLVAIFARPAHAAPSALTQEDYARAERFLGWNALPLGLNLEPIPVWVANQDRFWYVHHSPRGKDFVLVDAHGNRQGAAFDHTRLAAALSQADGQNYTADALPFDAFDFVNQDAAAQFHIKKVVWTCTLDTYQCSRASDAVPPGRGRVVSPDKQWAAFVRDYNLWVESVADHGEIPLTTRGRQHDAYAVEAEADTVAVTERLRFPDNPLANAVWSPDSRRLITYQLDESKMQDSYLVQSVPPGPIGSRRPVLHTFRFPYPGDKEVATAQYVILEPASRTQIVTDLPIEEVTFDPALSEGSVWWSADSRTIYAILADRWALTQKLFAIDPGTGKSRLLIEEHGDSELQTVAGRDGAPAVKIINRGRQAIWFSERDGWGHLYLYDLESRHPVRQITRGAWTVRSLEYVDEAKGVIYFTASGKEPGEDAYLRHLYRIRLDGTHLQLLTPENGDHSVVLSASGKYFVDTYSRVDTIPTTVLRDQDGKLIRTVGTADITKLTAAGWKFPEPFRAKAADGVTDIYGVIFRPSNFDPHNRYPVIDSIYPGPQHIRSPKTLPDAVSDTPQSLAELGFVVVTVDGRGTPLRSRAFHDYSYKKLGVAGGLEDHIAAIRQLAQRYPYVDADRVGIYGHSAGGFATARALLAYPDFYKVGVSSAGNHDQRGNIATWGERYIGRLEEGNYEEASNPVLALKAPLKGKLLLAWGDMDDNVSPFLSVQLIDSLIKTNSDFDVLVLPNCNHRLASINPYFIRRRWDYFVRNLLGAAPPQGYEIKTISPAYIPLQPQPDAAAGSTP
jgi:dipeptidyl aminopeptidase/acylaminoacyl peptidase